MVRQKILRKAVWWILGVLVVAGILWGPLSSMVEQARYSVVETVGSIEIRDYQPMIVAEVEVPGEREEAINRGFRLIADYIFGNNEPSQKVAMTAPVLQQAGEKIAMTAPVTQESANGTWKVRFVMPASYSLSTLPKPRNDVVRIKEINAKRFVAIRFSGVAEMARITKNTQKLEEFIHRRKLTSVSSATYAFYNPPWTLPFLRRNEVLIEITK